MDYEVTQIISYIVKANSQEEALEIWNADSRTGVTQWSSDSIELYDERIEISYELDELK